MVITGLKGVGRGTMDFLLKRLQTLDQRPVPSVGKTVAAKEKKNGPASCR